MERFSGRRTLVVGFGTALLVGAVLGPLAPGALAAARPVPVPAPPTIKPNQTFAGVVNGDPNAATVEVACTAALRPGERGHPVSGQTIGVRSPASSATGSGTTGSKGRTIMARFLSSTPTVSTSAAAATVTFTHYGTEPLPTTLLLPCLGSGSLVFSAQPSSTTARNETMAVTYTTPCQGICADNRR
jgi:hypothetical protein